jgi:hypothetical protein
MPRSQNTRKKAGLRETLRKSWQKMFQRNQRLAEIEKTKETGDATEPPGLGLPYQDSCSSTSAADIAGYYDRGGYPDL